MDADDRELFGQSLGQVAADHTGTALDVALEQLGWCDALADDDEAAISLLFGHLGSTNSTCGALDHVIAAALGVDADTAGIVLSPLGGSRLPGRLVGADGGARVDIAGLGTARLLRQPTVLVPVARGDKAIVVPIPAPALTVQQRGGIDDALALVDVSGAVLDVDAASCQPVQWSDAVALAQMAIGHELVGESRRMLELAREHALGRVQFGQPISGFQAIRHRLAETLVAIETAEALLSGAWEDRSPVTAAMAKAASGRAARTTARHAQQVLAGIGFTTEHPFHLYVRRVLVLDEIFGSARSLTADLGADILRTRELPPLLPL